MYKTTDIYPAKTTALLSMFFGGQFEPVSGGQFEMAGGGQFLLAEGGQFAWIFHQKGIFEQIEFKLYELITKFELIIQPIKTQRSFFTNGKLQKGEKPVTYLGFQFDGNRKLIKSASLSKFYRKMKSNVKFRAVKASIAKAKSRKKGIQIDTTLHRKKLYSQFSFLGSSKSDLKKRNYISYANFAARIMDSPHIQNQLSNAWRILHEEIAKQERQYRLPKIKQFNKEQKPLQRLDEGA